MAMPDTSGLVHLMKSSSGWGAFLLLNPPGDVPFLVSIVPSLKWHEIVSIDGLYDIWFAEKKSRRVVESQLTLEQIKSWLSERMPAESEIEANAVKWTEQALERYGVPKRNL